MRFRAFLGFAVAAALLSPAPAGATPEDPYGEDWVAIAVSPEARIGTYGAAGSAEAATQIAMDECTQRSNGARCQIATATQYGCVAFGIDVRTNAWAGGRGPDEDAALSDVVSKLPRDFTEGDVVGGPACSTPRVPPVTTGPLSVTRTHRVPSSRPTSITAELGRGDWAINPA